MSGTFQRNKTPAPSIRMAQKLSSKTGREEDMVSRTTIMRLEPIENAPYVKNDSTYSFNHQKIVASLNNSEIKNTTVESFHSY
jgi:hypothetical protein